MVHGTGIGKVTAYLPHAQGLQGIVVPTIEAQHLVAAFDQATAQGLTKKTTTTGNQNLHSFDRSAAGLPRRLAVAEAMRFVRQYRSSGASVDC